SVSVVASDDRFSSVPAIGSARVVNTPPTAAVTLQDVAPWKHDALLAVVNASDLDRQQLTYAFTWSVGGIVRQTSTGTSASNAFDLRAARANNGDVVAVEVIVSDGTASVRVSTSAVV